MTLGQQLQQLREAAGYDIARLHQETRVSERYLRALESDQLDILPAATYVRGYLRHVAAVLSADPAPLLSAYDQALGEPAPAPAPAVTESPVAIEQPAALDEADCSRPSGRSYLLDLIGLTRHLVGYLWSELLPWLRQWRLSRPLMLLLALILVLSLLPWRCQSSPGTVSEPVDVATAVTPAEHEPEKAQSLTDLAPQADEDKVETPAETAVTIEEAAMPTPATSAPATPSSPLDSVELRFHGPSVIRVTDARGRELAAGLMRAGQTLRLEGRKPFDIRVGNPAVTEVFVNGEPATFKPM